MTLGSPPVSMAAAGCQVLVERSQRMDESVLPSGG